MSPKLIHQTFPSESRTAFSFDDGSPDVYVGYSEGEKLLDTELLPQESPLIGAITTAHLLMLKLDLERRGISIESAFDHSPHVRALAFTLLIVWSLNKETRIPEIEIKYDVNPHAPKRSMRVGLPKVSAVRSVDVVTATSEMDIWRFEWGFIKV
jgi:hypothetical protein